MTGRSDVQEYIDMVEDIMRRKEIPRVEWAPTLIPLLSEKYWGIAVKLPQETREDYSTLRTALLDRDETQGKNTAASF